MNDQEFSQKWVELEDDLQAIDQKLVSLQASSRETAPVWWTTENAMTISSVVLGFGVVVILISAWLMRGSRPSAEAILRVFGTVLIITGALFLVVAGYSDKQMAPVMGLLGTLAGYLLGKTPTEKPNSTEPKK